MLSLSNLSIDFLKSNDYAIAAFIPFLKLCSSEKNSTKGFYPLLAYNIDKEFGCMLSLDVIRYFVEYSFLKLIRVLCFPFMPLLLGIKRPRDHIK